jgi:hypothetical protein
MFVLEYIMCNNIQVKCCIEVYKLNMTNRNYICDLIQEPRCMLQVMTSPESRLNVK